MANWIKPCPVCGTELDLLVLIAHDGAREALRCALELPAPLDKLAVQYAGLFRPKKRGLTADRVADLLGDVLGIVKAGEVMRNGSAHAAPPAVIAEAIRQMLDRRDMLRLPLSGHGYLFEVISGISAAQAARSESTALVPVSPDEAPRRELNSKTSAAFSRLEQLKQRG